MGESSNLDLQRKSCRVVIGIEGVKEGKVCRFLPKDFDFKVALESLASDGFRYYGIIHDKDTSEYKHIHLVLFSTKTLRLKQFLNACCDAFNCDCDNVSVRETTNVNKNIQYLIHKNENDSKYKYDTKEVFSNAPQDEFDGVFKTDENTYDELVSTESLIDTVVSCKNPTELVVKLGFKFVNNNYRILTLLIKTYHDDWIPNLW